MKILGVGVDIIDNSRIKNVVFKGAIKEVSKEALLVMQNKRLTTQNKPYPGFKKPKSDNIAIGYLI